MSGPTILYLFDIDGTLLLTGGAGSAALNDVFERRYGLSGAMDGVSAAGKTDPLIVAEIFATRMSRNPQPEEIDAILADYVPCLQAALLARASRFCLMPAVSEILDFLAAEPNVHLGVATGNIRPGARAKLEHAGLWDRFALGGFGDDAPQRALLVERAIERGRAHAGEAIARDRIVVVGDTERDVAAAHACQVRAVAVTTGFTGRDNLDNAGADAVMDTLAELPDWHRSEFG